MRIAVASEGLYVAPSFERCASFTCYSAQRGIIVDCQNMPNLGFSPQHLVTLLHELHVCTLITGEIEPSSQSSLRDANIEVITQATGSAREATEAYLYQELIASDDMCATEDDSEEIRIPI